MNKYDLVIVGGGAAGMMAGIRVVRAGGRVVILERMSSVGKKLLVTGGGRCNLTRDIPVTQFLEAYYGKKNFVRPAIYSLPPVDLIAFFEGIGVECVVDSSAGVYPKSNKARDVLNVLNAEYARLGGEIVCNVSVENIIRSEEKVKGVVAGGLEYLAPKVLLAAGGCSMGELGSNGRGFELAREVGHKIVPPLPALVGLVVPELPHVELAGVSLANCSLTIGKRKKKQVFIGDLLFTHKGVSGPVVLDISGLVAREIEMNGEAEILLSCSSESKTEWEGRFEDWRRTAGHSQIAGLLSEYYPKRFIRYMLDSCGATIDTNAAELKKIFRDRIITKLTGYNLGISRTEGFKKSMVTSGGVNTKEVNSKTLESKIILGLFFAGEVVDVDGLCGGYNLQWAFASATLAAESLIKS